jgi:uncharacterized protein YgiM (DUF1202 family)
LLFASIEAQHKRGESAMSHEPDAITREEQDPVLFSSKDTENSLALVNRRLLQEAEALNQKVDQPSLLAAYRLRQDAEEFGASHEVIVRAIVVVAVLLGGLAGICLTSAGSKATASKRIAQKIGNVEGDAAPPLRQVRPRPAAVLSDAEPAAPREIKQIRVATVAVQPAVFPDFLMDASDVGKRMGTRVASVDATVSPKSEEPEVVFLQRADVNIRSAPAQTSRVVGKAPRGSRFEVKKRSSDWVQVESTRFKGWVSDRFVGPTPPR